MKKQEIERIRAILAKEGYEVNDLGHADTFVIKPGERETEDELHPSPWQRVDFVKVIDTNGLLNVTLNKIYALIDYRFGEVRFKNDRGEVECRNVIHGNFVSATKVEYFEQLKNDFWEGVEFIKSNTRGWIAVHKVSKIKDDKIYFSDGTWSFKDFCLPATESEYVKELKKEAFERFGEIKEGDRFDCSVFGNTSSYTLKNIPFKVFRYYRKHDQLFLYNFRLYQSGKWATKLPEMVKVKTTNTTLYATQMNNQQEIEIRFESSKPINKSKQSIGDLLSKQLEKYLNTH